MIKICEEGVIMRIQQHYRTALATLSTAILLFSSAADAAELGGMLKTQSSYNTVEHDWQKQDWQLDLELNTVLGAGDLTAITRLTMDTEDQLNHSEKQNTYSQWANPSIIKQHGDAALREFYWVYQGDTVFWRLGKQQVVWGEADGLKLLDIVNPQNYREFILDDFDDSRIPLWMVNAEVNVGDDGLLQVLWIPDTTTNSLAPVNSPYWFSSPLLVPQASPGLTVQLEESQASSKPIKDSDFGLRLSQYWSGWDITFNYLYHTVDDPVLSTRINGTVAHIESGYERSHLIGGSASNAFGDWTLRSEIAYETNRFHRSTQVLPGVIKANQWASVIGLDFQGWTNQFISFQWFQTRILANDDLLIKSKTEDIISLLWETKFMNDTLTLSWLNLYSLDHHDGLFRPKISYNLISNLDLTLGVDRFYGQSEGLFGQFDQTDRINIGFEWGIN